MRNNTHLKRTSFWKSLIAVVTIILGIFCNTEARVTREVAEATIPYLLEAVGIPPHANGAVNTARRDAIVHMLYTDAGQREMVNWAVNDQSPATLTAQFQPWPNPSSNVIYAPNAQPAPERIFQLLFPRGPGTFSSYNHHASRLGKWVLSNNGVNLQTICRNLLFPPIKSNVNAEGQIRSNLLASMPIDTKLACVLFLLDICDTANQIFDILDARHAMAPITGYTLPIVGAGGTRNTPIAIVYNEYSHRPVPAIAANTSAAWEGDCVQTLYRHLVNIAIQNDNTNSRNFNLEHLSVQLRGYYTTRHGAIDDGIIIVPVTETEAGLTQLMHHQSWHDALAATVPGGTNITNGAIDNIVTVLGAVRPAEMATSALNMIERAYIAPALNPTIHTSTGVDGAGTNQQANATAIQNALNALDGRCNVGNERFIVSVTDYMGDLQIIAIQNQLPTGTDLVIQIADRLWNRMITIGARIAGTAHAHAEIISIN